MHLHSILMIAATGVVAAFVPIVSWLTRRGILSNRQPGLAFQRWAPPIAAICSIGAAVIHERCRAGGTDALTGRSRSAALDGP